MSDIIVGFSPNDFYYVNANVDMPPTLDACPSITRDSCDTKYDEDTANMHDCYLMELCKNKENADSIQKMKNNHLGSDQNYLNMKNIYMNEYMKTIHYSAAIILLVGIIFYSK